MRLALVTTAALGLAPSTARADQPIPVHARELAARGRALHAAGDYARAIGAFEQAYTIAPSPGLLFNLAQAHRLQGHCGDAAVLYRRFLASPSPDGKALAEAHLATVERCAHTRGLAAWIDHARADATLPLLPPGPVPARPLRRPRSAQRDLGVVVSIGGAVTLAIAASEAVRARNAARAVERAHAAGAKWQDLAPTHRRGQAAAADARVLGIAGGLAVAAGATLFVLGRRAERALPVAVTPTPDGAEVSHAWSF